MRALLGQKGRYNRDIEDRERRDSTGLLIGLRLGSRAAYLH
jgi:hypothetical protein